MPFNIRRPLCFTILFKLFDYVGWLLWYKISQQKNLIINDIAHIYRSEIFFLNYLHVACQQIQIVLKWNLDTVIKKRFLTCEISQALS
jgi:hypothetical protein